MDCNGISCSCTVDGVWLLYRSWRPIFIVHLLFMFITHLILLHDFTYALYPLRNTLTGQSKLAQILVQCFSMFLSWWFLQFTAFYVYHSSETMPVHCWTVQVANTNEAKLAANRNKALNIATNAVAVLFCCPIWIWMGKFSENAEQKETYKMVMEQEKTNHSTIWILYYAEQDKRNTSEWT